MVIMAQDEGRFGRISDPRRCWAPPGIRPKAPKQVIREYLVLLCGGVPRIGENDISDPFIRKHRNDEHFPEAGI